MGNENGAPSGVRFAGPTASNAGVEALISWEPPAAPGGAPALFKYMLGTFHFATWTGPAYPNASSTSFAANNSEWSVTADCRHGCLFHLSSDPAEHSDVSAALPAVAARLRARLLVVNATAFSPKRGLADNTLGCRVALGKYGGFWGPFLSPPPPRRLMLQ